MTFPRQVLAITALTMAFGAGTARADTTVLTEGFDSLATTLASGWTAINRSPGGSTDSWVQGNADIFTAQAGADAAFAANNYLSGATGGTISDWLITPVLALNPQGSTLSFYTRAANDPGFSDNLNVLFSASGGTAASDFTSTLLTITNVGADWTQYTVSFGAGATQGRIAFVYAQQANLADYIGLDTVSVTTAAVPEPTTYGMMGLALALGAGWSWQRRRAAAR